MDQLELLQKVLRLPQHWRVVDVETDEETRQLTVSLHFVETRRRLIGGPESVCARCKKVMTPTPASRFLRLRHLPLADWQVVLLLPDSTAGCADRGCPASADFAEPGTRVTHAMASRMIELHTGGASLSTTAALLDVEVTDVAQVLAARGMPVDALTGEITVAAGLLADDDHSHGLAQAVPGDLRAKVGSASPPSSAAEPAAAPPERPAPVDEQLPAFFGEQVSAEPTPSANVAPGDLALSDTPPTDTTDVDHAPDTRVTAPATSDERSFAAAHDASEENGGEVPEASEDLVELADAEVDSASVGLEPGAVGDAPPGVEAPSDPGVPPAQTQAPEAEETVGDEDQVQPPEVVTAARQILPGIAPAPVARESTPTSADASAGDDLDRADGALAGDDQGEQVTDDTSGTATLSLLAQDEEEAQAALDDAIEGETDALTDDIIAAPDPSLDDHLAGEVSASDSEDNARNDADAEDAPPDVEPEAPEAIALESSTTPSSTTSEPRAPVEVPELQALVRPARAKAAASSLPPLDHPVWRDLLGGAFNLETQALALQMLITRLRQFVRTSEDGAAVAAAARVLHKHLDQHARRYLAEHEQLRSRAERGAGGQVAPASVQRDRPGTADIPTLSAPVAPSEAPTVPPPSDPVWEALVSGERDLDTSSVALKMMLQQIRRTVDSDPSNATRAAGVRLLQTFFAKTSRQLGNELRQLQGNRPEANVGWEPQRSGADESPVVGGDDREVVQQPRIPPETSPSWQALLDGRVMPSANDPGLSMLMEKVKRVTTQGETSGEVMAAAGRVLRRYLARYAHRHEDLLGELNALDLSTSAPERTSRLSRSWRGGRRGTAAAAANVQVPPVDDPVWGRLMDGDLALETEAFALRMMLERIRRSVRRDPSDGNRQAAAAQLRDYFVKHERVHRAELQRIRVA